MTWDTWDSLPRSGVTGARRGSAFEPDLSKVFPPKAHPARVYNRWLGGKDNLSPDRFVADHVAELAPWVVTGARANRAFLQRAVRFVAESGVRQFLDVGCGLPSAGAVHEVARQHRPDAKVVYVDHDPIVLVHARALLTDTSTTVVGGDVRDPARILADRAVSDHLDLGRPVAVLLVALLHFLMPTDHPASVVAAFREALAPGSFVVISHAADLPDDDRAGGRAAANQEALKLYQDMTAPAVLRTREQIADLFAGLDLVRPGLVPANEWRARPGSPGPPLPMLAGVGRVR